MLSHLRILLIALLLTSFFVPVSAATSCNDIDLTPRNVTFSEDRENRLITFDIENNANDDFDLDDVRVQESSSYLDVSVDDFPQSINEDESETLRLRYDTVDVNGDKSETFRIQLKGEFTGDDEECSFTDLSFTIDVTIQDGDDVCSLIQIEADDVTVTENDTLLHTIRVTNHSTNDFTLQGFDVFDDGDSYTASAEPPFSDADFQKNISRNQTNTYTIEIDAKGVSDDETDATYVELRGEFENGYDCSFSDISESFDVTVEDTGVQTGVCTELNVNIPFVSVYAGQTNQHAFTLTNTASQNFYVDEYFISDKNYQVAFEPLSNPVSVDFDSTQEVLFESTGYSNNGSFDANAFLTLKGHFTDGGSCLVNAKRFAYEFIGNENATCDSFYAGINPVIVMKGEKTIDVLFNNPLSVDAVLTLSADGGKISPAHIRVPANTAIVQTFFVDSTTGVAALRVNTEIQGCTIQEKNSKILFSGLDNAPVQLVNPPAVINLLTAEEFALSLYNQSAYEQEVTLNVIGKPGTQTFTKTFSLPGLDESLVYVPTSSLRGKSVAIIQVTSAGYTITQTVQLENNPPATNVPSASTATTPVSVAVSAVTGFVTQTGGFWLGLAVLLAIVAIWHARQESDEETTNSPKSNITKPADFVDIDELDAVWLPSRHKKE